MGINEIFSIFLERLTRNKKYLEKQLKISNSVKLDKIIELNNFMELFFMTFYSANPLTKMVFWVNKRSIENTNKIYSSMMKKYTNIVMPGQYLDASPHNARINNVRTKLFISCCKSCRVRKKLKNYTGNWWESEEAGKYLKSMMKDGTKINFQDFSTLDSRVFLKEITG